MPSRLQQEIRQTKPFANLESEAYLSLVRLEQVLSDAVRELLKTADLSMPQYNALRILRGAGETGLACREIGERLVHRVPDVTRLLDRLESRGLVERQRETGDRRVVRVRITPDGLDLIRPLDEPVANIHVKNLGHLDRDRLQVFIDLIDEIRNAPTGDA